MRQPIFIVEVSARQRMCRAVQLPRAFHDKVYANTYTFQQKKYNTGYIKYFKIQPGISIPVKEDSKNISNNCEAKNYHEVFSQTKF